MVHPRDALFKVKPDLSRHGSRQVILVLEVRVERTLGDIRRLGDLVDRKRIEPALGHQSLRRRHKFAARPFALACSPGCCRCLTHK